MPFLLAFRNAVYIGVVNMVALQLADLVDSNIFNSNGKNFYTMIEEVIGKHAIKRHDSPGELVVTKYNMFNQYALYDSEVGGYESIAGHFHRMNGYLKSGKMDDLNQAHKNLNQAFAHVFQGNNFPALQWAALLHSIDGEVITDISLENLKKIMAMLSEEGLTQNKVMADVEAAKKKFVSN